MKTALITGVGGQDGSYLAEYLLNKGYYVVGVDGLDKTENIKHLFSEVGFEYIAGDFSTCAKEVFTYYKVNEVYNLAAKSSVAQCNIEPHVTYQINTLGFLQLLETVRNHNKHIKVFQASSSEMYGDNAYNGAYDTTAFKPKNIYGISKLAAHETANFYRKYHNMFIACGIMFNHESERRNDTFVSKVIAKGVANIVMGKQQKIKLGDLGSIRDWGYAPDYVEAMYLMLQYKHPEDFIIATGKGYSVEEFLQECCSLYKLDYKKHWEFDESKLRKGNIVKCFGYPNKIKSLLNWAPKTSFQHLCSILVENEIVKATRKQ